MAENMTSSGDGMMETTAVMISNATTSSPEDPEAHLYAVAENIFLWVDPIITFGGILGNLLMFAVMQRKSQRNSPVAVFMSALAVTDSVVLFMDFINNWLKYGPKIYLLGTGGFCEFHRYVFNVAYTYASWLVMGVAVERFLVVWYPLKAKEICTVRGSRITVVVMAVVLLVFYLYNLWGYYISPEGFCDVHPEMSSFQNNVSPWLTAVLYSYIPILIILFSNIGIIYKLSQARRRRKSMSGEDKDAAMYKVTFTVAVICVTFFLLTTPLTLFYIIIFAAGEFIEQGPRTALAETFILILALMNHAVNFFLYVMTSDTFRVELRAMLCGGKPLDRRSTMRDTSGFRTKSTGATASGMSASNAEPSSVAENKV